MKKNDYKGPNNFLKALPYALIAVVLAAIVVVIINI